VTKKELVNHVADSAGLTKKDSAKAVDAVFDGIMGTLGDGEKVSLVGFGTFSVKHRKAREGVNPRQPNERIQYPAKNVPHFKAGKNLKEAVE
jgi:DNA-binding protein HU-beta